MILYVATIYVNNIYYLYMKSSFAKTDNYFSEIIFFIAHSKLISITLQV